VISVAVSYKKLWKLLIDRDMKKKDLLAAAGISQSSLSKMGRNENVNTDILVKICKALNCEIGDIMEIVQDDNQSRKI
jgi:DNA-binding Xre family transcriptional regulator